MDEFKGLTKNVSMSTKEFSWPDRIRFILCLLLGKPVTIWTENLNFNGKSVQDSPVEGE